MKTSTNISQIMVENNINVSRSNSNISVDVHSENQSDRVEMTGTVRMAEEYSSYKEYSGVVGEGWCVSVMMLSVARKGQRIPDDLLNFGRCIKST